MYVCAEEAHAHTRAHLFTCFGFSIRKYIVSTWHSVSHNVIPIILMFLLLCSNLKWFCNACIYLLCFCWLLRLLLGSFLERKKERSYRLSFFFDSWISKSSRIFFLFSHLLFAKVIWLWKCFQRRAMAWGKLHRVIPSEVAGKKRDRSRYPPRDTITTRNSRDGDNSRRTATSPNKRLTDRSDLISKLNGTVLIGC